MKLLNAKNRKILKYLDEDARMSNTQIAKKLRINKNVVNYNIKKLEDGGLIKGYDLMVDNSSLGFVMFRVYIDFYERDIKVDDEFIEYLIKCDNAGSVARVVGEWDVVVSFYVKNASDFRKVWFDILKKFREHIKDYQVNLVDEKVFFRRSYLLKEKKNLSDIRWEIGNGRGQELDKLDMDILKMLVKDARVQVKDIALKTKKSSMAIIYRIKQLVKKKVIKGYRAFIDFEKLGYQRYNIKFHLDDINIFDKLVNFCNMQPNIVKVDKSIGTFDFEFDMEIKDFEEFSEIIDKIKIQFPGVIRDYKYLRFLRYYKRNHLPL